MLLLHLNKSGSSTQQGSIRQFQAAELLDSSSLQVPETIKPIAEEEGLFREYLIQLPKMDSSTKKYAFIFISFLYSNIVILFVYKN